jgi:WD40 repeat protein
VLVCREQVVILVDLAVPGERLLRMDAMPGASGLAFLPDGRTAISGENDGAVIQWDLETGKEMRRFGRHDDLRTRVEISLDGKLMLTSGMNGVLRLWDLETGELVREFGYSKPAVVFDNSLSPDGHTAITGSIDQTITLSAIANTSLRVLLDWIAANRFVREVSCEERERYQIQPLCP